MKTLILLAILPIAVTAYAQGDGVFLMEDKGRVLSNIAHPISPNSPGISRPEIKGSPFLFEDWVMGKVWFEEKKQVSDEIAFNVNATEGEGIYALLPNGQVFDVNEKVIDELQVQSNGKTVILRPIRASKLQENKEGVWIVEVLYEDAENTLLKHAHKSIRKADAKGPYSANRPYDEFIDHEDYYLSVNGRYHEIKLNKKSISELVPEAGAKLKGNVTEESVVEALK